MSDALGLGDDDQRREEAAKVIQKKWRETRKVVQVEEGEDDTTQQETFKRTRLLQEYKEYVIWRDKLLQENLALQRKLAHWYHEKKKEDAEKHPNQDQSAAEIETRYLQWLKRLRAEREELERTKKVNEESFDEYRAKLQAHVYKASEFEAKFKAFKREICEQAQFTRTGKPIPPKRVEQFEKDEEAKNEEVQAVRISYIKTRNKMKLLEKLLKEKEKLTDGLHLIDFEQLKIENTTLNEKIEERNEDLLKLRKKATTTIHILTHAKEKLQFLQGENQNLKKQLANLEEELAEHRDRLTQVKRDRDMLVNDNIKMREKMPMVGAEDLLLDYEFRKKEIERLRTEVVELKNKHYELFVWIASNTPQEAMK